MRFTQLDRITELREGESIIAIKALSLAEEYLKDHFPRFPVMPGVIMLEAMFQASAWLVRKSESFFHTAVVLKEARNVKYADFVQPGQLLEVRANLIKQDEVLTTLKTEGTVDGKASVSARLVLERFNVGDRHPSRADQDGYTRRKMRKTFDLLYAPASSLDTDS